MRSFRRSTFYYSACVSVGVRVRVWIWESGACGTFGYTTSTARDTKLMLGLGLGCVCGCWGGGRVWGGGGVMSVWSCIHGWWDWEGCRLCAGGDGGDAAGAGRKWNWNWSWSLRFHLDGVRWDIWGEMSMGNGMCEGTNPAVLSSNILWSERSGEWPNSARRRSTSILQLRICLLRGRGFGFGDRCICLDGWVFKSNVLMFQNTWKQIDLVMIFIDPLEWIEETGTFWFESGMGLVRSFTKERKEKRLACSAVPLHPEYSFSFVPMTHEQRGYVWCVIGVWERVFLRGR